VQKLRPPRYIQSDGIVMPYVYRDAEGHQILQVMSVVTMCRNAAYFAPLSQKITANLTFHDNYQYVKC